MSGRRRGEHRDPVGDALTTLWVLGHTVVLGLLSVLVQHNHQAGAVSQAPVPAAAPDTVPPA
ncbi:hypothetical protein [Kitasatospora sp. MAP5-34]|uniref:hypothetical protein n=1 Tax=Kitasatospora sp. MAP5-34 TaxID=3035102 RepID=UPI002474A5E5|nr:hypothetical protein [Kitasatospora sp. MAP5-34]MDH6577563.1 hypothetical protein [Kitasatospora sp. MAP5-34]